MGVQIRDVKDEFKGADFRDEETKLMFAYDYANRHVIRIWGFDIKPRLFYEMKRLGVRIYNRTVITGLLTEGGRQGARVVGATGVNMRTGSSMSSSRRQQSSRAGGGEGSSPSPRR